MDAITLQNASPMPAPTWHRLSMNGADIETPADLIQAHDAIVEVPEGESALSVTAVALTDLEGDAFDTAVDALSARTYATRISAQDLAGEADDDTDGVRDTAYSRYQIDAAETERAASVAAAFETGMGADARAFLLQAAGEVIVVEAPEGSEGAATVRLNGIDGAVNTAAVDIVAHEGAHVDIAIAFDTPTEGVGAIGATLRVFAGKDAVVRVTAIQTADDSWQCFDDEGYVLDESAKVEVRHTVLGAGESYTGLACDLRGTSSDIDMDTRYLGHGENELDFNYVIRHHGQRTMSELNANGVLAGESVKTLRGTIDLIRGCKGANGHESETVLIADDGAHNRTVPVILCSEDDVAGNHGATIGHIRPEQKFYLACRGLSPDAAEAMFARAQIENAEINAVDETVRASVVRLGKTLLGDYEGVEQ